MRGLLLGSGLVCAAAAMTYAVRGRSATLLAPSVCRGPGNRPSIALTFDDGPSESTPELLELLERFQVRATFFQCGMHVRRLPAVAQSVVARGHEIGNHTDTHTPLYFRSAAFIYKELERAQETIAAVTGATPTLFRAPYGARWIGLRQAQARLRLRGVMWTAIGRDWKLGSNAIAGRLLRAARNGAIFCLHDGRETRERPDISATIGAVRELVPALIDRGFYFETLSKLLCPAK